MANSFSFMPIPKVDIIEELQLLVDLNTRCKVQKELMEDFMKTHDKVQQTEEMTMIVCDICIDIQRLDELIAYHTRLVTIVSNPTCLFFFNKDGINLLGFNKDGMTLDGRRQSIFGSNGYDIYDSYGVDAFNFDKTGYHSITGRHKSMV